MSQEGISNWGLDAAPQDSQCPETDKVMGGTQGRMERGGERWTPSGGEEKREVAHRPPRRSERSQPQGQ